MQAPSGGPPVCKAKNKLVKPLAEKKECYRYDTKLHLRLKLWWGSVEAYLNCNYSQVHGDPANVVPFRVTSIS